MNRSIRERLGLAIGALMVFVFSAPFLMVGAVFPVAVGLHLVDTQHWRQLSLPASAVVEERHLLNSSDEDPAYQATVIFTTANGEEVAANVRGDSPKPGAAVDIRYDPARPAKARLSSWGAEWYHLVGAIIFAAPFLAFGVLGVVGAIALALGRAELEPPNRMPEGVA
jgi:hypothetical protein